MTTKVDIINGAYSQLRISRLTIIPGDGDLEIALDRLETMAAEFLGRNIDVGYNFEDEPDLNSVHNIERRFWYTFETNLAVRLFSDFGKGKAENLDPVLIAAAQSSFSYLSTITAQLQATQYPTRQPRGSGNRTRTRYYYPTAIAPLISNKMYVGDIDDFIEHFDAYLADGEVISSYVITSDDGLTIVSDSNTDTDILYQVQADGGTTSDEYQQVKIVMTTDAGRVETRIINFQLMDADI